MKNLVPVLTGDRDLSLQRYIGFATGGSVEGNARFDNSVRRVIGDGRVDLAQAGNSGSHAAERDRRVDAVQRDGGSADSIERSRRRRRLERAESRRVDLQVLSGRGWTGGGKLAGTRGHPVASTISPLTADLKTLRNNTLLETLETPNRYAFHTPRRTKTMR